MVLKIFKNGLKKVFRKHLLLDNMPELKISPELTLLIKASIGETVELPFLMYQQKIHWERLSRLARWHQVRPMLFDYLTKAEIPGFSGKISENLREFTLGQAVTNMAFLGISVNLYRQLVDGGVHAFLMKGALWAWMFYDKPESREFGDIDFFLDQNDIQKSLTILSANGFEPDAYRTYLLREKQIARNYLSTDYQLPLKPRDENALQSLEIQWNASYPRYCYNFVWDDLAIDMIDFQIMNSTIRIPKMENQLLMMLVHHGGVEQWDKLKYVADFVRLLRKFSADLDWKYIEQITRKNGFNRLLLESIGLIDLMTGKDYLKYCQLMPESIYPSAGFLSEVIGHWEDERPIVRTKSWRILWYNFKYRDNWKTKWSIFLAHVSYLGRWRLIYYKIAWFYNKRLSL
jgi:hypothetical protein